MRDKDQRQIGQKQAGAITKRKERGRGRDRPEPLVVKPWALDAEICKVISEANHSQPPRYHSPPSSGSGSGFREPFQVRVGVLVRVSSSRSRRAQFWCPCCSARSRGRNPSCRGAVSRGRPLPSLSSSPSSFPPSGFALLQTAMGPPTRSRSAGSAPWLSSSSRPRRQPQAAATCSGVSASADLGHGRRRGSVKYLHLRVREPWLSALHLCPPA